MKVIVKVGFILGACAVLAIALGGGGNSSTDQVMPAPVPAGDTAATVAVVVGGYAPIVASSASAVDTLALLASPKPSFAEQWGNVLGAVCIVGLVVGACAFVAVVWLVLNSGLVARRLNAPILTKDAPERPGALIRALTWLERRGV